MIEIKVKLKSPYNIYIGYNIIEKVPRYMKQLNLSSSGVVVTSKKVFRLYKQLLLKVFPPDKFIILPVADGEGAKSKKYLFKVIDAIISCDKFSQKPSLVCFGGGTVGDLASFAASIYKRGIPYVQIPTTLLAQVDSSVGGKTAIDLKIAKNILGTIYQPKAVFVDLSFLATLSQKQIREGLAEVIKYAIIKKKSLFAYLKKNSAKILQLDSKVMLKIIADCLQIKANVVASDEGETKGIRTILNYGHTLAHALESVGSYQSISHGEAVAIGMVYAGYLSSYLKQCSCDIIDQIKSILELFGLPTTIDCDYKRIWESMRYDKKFIAGKIRMVLVREIGKVVVQENVPLSAIRHSLNVF